ncbi:hypothetical protein Q31b_00700 [Novipirellula aureliae]|uniref:Uncharacterized protein n=1 Tax=Novipirellula aureliae TaxID=2527966 RepID=A0A5C6E7U0_9BACT|nr:hypothetical protein Q31b_00700 [Novipirellula aureliae]
MKHFQRPLALLSEQHSGAAASRKSPGHIGLPLTAGYALG